MRPASLLLAASIITACGTVLEAPPADDAGTGSDTGGSSSGGGDASSVDGGDANVTPTVGCASLAPYLFCADFDQASTIETQTAKPGDLPIDVSTPSGDGKLTLVTIAPYSTPNAVNVAGNGQTAPFRGVFGRNAITLTKTHLRLRARIRVNTLPTTGDAFIATLDFENYRVSATLHASGTIGLAQSTPPNGPPAKAETPSANVVQPNKWHQLEINLDFTNPPRQVSAELDAPLRAYAAVPVVPTGPVTVGLGVGYCDVPCGKPSIDFDDVVLTEE